MSTILFPQISPGAAEFVFAEIESKSIDDLVRCSSTTHELAIFTQTGGRQISEKELGEIQAEVRGLARRYGYPEIEGGNRAEFDARCSIWLTTKIGISAAEAMRDGVWAFFGLVMLPDIVAWRFKGRNKRRFTGGIRNTFQRLWLRGYRLKDGDDMPALLKRLQALTEDTFLHLIERPGLSSNPRLSTRIAEAWMRNRSLSNSSSIMDQAHENVMMELIQTGAVVCLDTLPQNNLDEMLDHLYSEQIHTLERIARGESAA